MYYSGAVFDAWTTPRTHEFLADPKAAQPKIERIYAYFEQNIARRKKEPGTKGRSHQFELETVFRGQNA